MTITAHIVLGLDPGLASVGWAVISAVGTARQLIDCGTIHTPSTDTDDERARVIGERVAGLLACHSPDVVGVEAHVWMGATRSANPEAFRVSRVSGLLEGLAVASKAHVHRVTRRDALAAVGARTEDGANATLRRIMKLPARCSQHARDAALIAIAAEKAERRKMS